MYFILVTFIAVTTRSCKKQLKEGNVCFDSQFMVTEFIMVGKACDKGMLTEKVERMNGTFSSMLSLFHFSFSFRDPSPWDGFVHIRGGPSSSVNPFLKMS